jgi:hypothetical protein
MSDTTTSKPIVRRLPATLTGLRNFNPEASQKARVRSLIDEVQALHDDLWEDSEDYRLLFEAISSAGTQEGSLSADSFKASTMIRALALNDNRNDWVGHKKLAEIQVALNRVRRRYGISLRQLKGLPDKEDGSDD